MQDEIFPDKEHFGRIFRNNARMSSEGIVQLAAIMGSCVAGGAYLPIMSAAALIVDGPGSVFLAASSLVTSPIGASVANHPLGAPPTPPPPPAATPPPPSPHPPPPPPPPPP